MSLTITQIPITYLDGDTGSSNKSKWNAAFEPIIYKGIRKDVNCWITNSGGFVVVNTPASFVSGAVVGDTLYLMAGVYNKLGTITAINGTAYTTNISFTLIAGGYVNFHSRKN